MPPLDASTTLSYLDRELWLVTSAKGGSRGGLVATFVLGISLVPELPRVCLGLAQHHHTRGLIEASDAFALHLIGERHLDWVWRFGLVSGRDGDKFIGLASQAGQTGSPILQDALAWMDCRVETRCDIGDRMMYVGEVVDASPPPAERCLTAAQLFRLAPPDKLRQLEELVRRDREIDRRAILAWRHACGQPPAAGPQVQDFPSSR
jgi:flavin reductase (DIM6/NTAB) family NADH-FMN oxidoreductase RutF